MLVNHLLDRMILQVVIESLSQYVRSGLISHYFHLIGDSHQPEQ